MKTIFLREIKMFQMCSLYNILTFCVTQPLGETCIKTKKLWCLQSPPPKDLQWFRPSHSPLVSLTYHMAACVWAPVNTCMHIVQHTSDIVCLVCFKVGTKGKKKAALLFGLSCLFKIYNLSLSLCLHTLLRGPWQPAVAIATSYSGYYAWMAPSVAILLGQVTTESQHFCPFVRDQTDKVPVHVIKVYCTQNTHFSCMTVWRWDRKLLLIGLSSKKTWVTVSWTDNTWEEINHWGPNQSAVNLCMCLNRLPILSTQLLLLVRDAVNNYCYYLLS